MWWRRAVGALPVAAAMLFVVLAYVFAGSTGRFSFPLIDWQESYYASLSEGFLSGRVSMAHVPDPALVAVPDPYLPELRKGVPSLHDASYFEGRYYLYFTPLPALLAYIPVKLVAGRYPSDALVGTLFAIGAFLAQAAFLLRAVRNRRWFWILFAGVGNITLFLLVDIWMYEVAAFCGMFFASLWAYALLRFHQNATWRTAALLGTFLALSIAARPTLLILGVVTLFALRNWRHAVALAVPVLLVGSMYAAYNQARFRSPFETGQQYQLTNVALRDYPACRLCTGPELGRFFNSVNQYLFRAPSVNARFPFVALSYNEYDPAVMFPAKHEEVGGVLAVIPLVGAGALLLLLVPARDRTATLLTGAGWLTLFGLSTCAWITARYELDFLPAMVLGSIVAIESGLAQLNPSRLARAVVTLLAVYSIVVGTLLGFTGRTQAFNRFNPELFQRISGWFSS
ncbi:MAG TPA: hypothetical protein VGF28_26835 [Thermoanaerobaculia bacterium]|jgi:hypothetical protein